VYNAVKSQVLSAVARPTSAAITDEAGAAQSVPSVRVLQDYSHLPVTFVSISSAADLARLRAHPNVVSVRANGLVRPVSQVAWEHVGQPAVLAAGWRGTGTVAVIDTGEQARVLCTTTGSLQLVFVAQCCVGRRYCHVLLCKTS
jgi:hypothetical protein